MSAKKEPEILVTDETRLVVEHYLQKQWARKAKRAAAKADKQEEKAAWMAGKGKTAK